MARCWYAASIVTWKRGERFECAYVSIIDMRMMLMLRVTCAVRIIKEMRMKTVE